MPTGAEIYLDQSFVGNTPPSIDVAAGKHLISIKKPGFTNWEREIAVTSGNISLAADLVPGPVVAEGVPKKRITGDSSYSVTAGVIATHNTLKASPVAAVDAPGWIGVSTRRAKNGGAAIASIVPNGPAAKAGLRVGDVITEVNGASVADQDFDAAIGRYKSGSKVRVSYMRDYWQLETIATAAVAGS